jgi:hypothetical protein
MTVVFLARVQIFSRELNLDVADVDMRAVCQEVVVRNQIGEEAGCLPRKGIVLLPEIPTPIASSSLGMSSHS